MNLLFKNTIFRFGITALLFGFSVSNSASAGTFVVETASEVIGKQGGVREFIGAGVFQSNDGSGTAYRHPFSISVDDAVADCGKHFLLQISNPSKYQVKFIFATIVTDPSGEGQLFKPDSALRPFCSLSARPAP